MQGIRIIQVIPIIFQCFIHPDFVLANVVATSKPGIVVVYWANAGWGPRLWPLAYLLLAEGAKDPRRAALVLAGYGRKPKLTAEEIDRLEAMIRARPLVLYLWRLRHGLAGAPAVLAHALEARRLAKLQADGVRARAPA